MPEITTLDHYDLVKNDPEATKRVTDAGRLGELPTNHNPPFAPVIHPTLETGMETLVVAAEAWLVA